MVICVVHSGPQQAVVSQGSTEKCPLDVTTENPPVTFVRAAAEGRPVGGAEWGWEARGKQRAWW